MFELDAGLPGRARARCRGCSASGRAPASSTTRSATRPREAEFGSAWLHPRRHPASVQLIDWLFGLRRVPMATRTTPRPLSPRSATGGCRGRSATATPGRACCRRRAPVVHDRRVGRDAAQRTTAASTSRCRSCTPAASASSTSAQVNGPRIDLATDAVVRTAGAKDYAAATRLYGLVDGHLLWAWDIAALGQDLRTHASGRLARVD